MKAKISPFWGYLTLALVILTLVLCVVSAKNGTLLVKADAKPQETVETFFVSVVIGKYDAAYACLANYDSLGLENQSDSLKWKRLLESYDYALLGEPEQKGDTAVQTVRFRSLDMNALELALETPIATIPGGEGEADRDIFPTAEELLAQPEQFYRTTELQIQLRYEKGQWLIVADESLLKALSGGK